MTVFFEKQMPPEQPKLHRGLDVAYMNMRASLVNSITDADKTNLAVIKPIANITVWTKNIYENITSAFQKHSAPRNLEDYCALYQQALADLPNFKKKSISISLRSSYQQFIEAIQQEYDARDLRRKIEVQCLKQQEYDSRYTSCKNYLQQLDIKLREKKFSKELLEALQILRADLQKKLDKRQQLETLPHLLQCILGAISNDDELTASYFYTLADRADNNNHKKTAQFFMHCSLLPLCLSYFAIQLCIGLFLEPYSMALFLAFVFVSAILFFWLAIVANANGEHITSVLERIFDGFRSGLSRPLAQVAFILRKSELERVYERTMSELDLFAKTSPYQDIIVKLITVLKKDNPDKSYIDLVCRIKDVVRGWNTLDFLSRNTVPTEVRMLMQRLEHTRSLDKLQQQIALFQNTDPKVANSLTSFITALRRMDGNTQIITLIHDLIYVLNNLSIKSIHEFECEHDRAGYRLSYASRIKNMFLPNPPLNELQLLLDNLKNSLICKNRNQSEIDAVWSRLQQV